jgi:hypothetical protein
MKQFQEHFPAVMPAAAANHAPSAKWLIGTRKASPAVT